MKEPLIKTRKFTVAGLKDPGNLNKIKQYFKDRIGIIAVEVDSQKKFLRVEYDLNQITFEVIEKSIKEMGFKLSQKLTDKFRRGMAKYTEQNELDNLSAASSSCCADPKEKKQGCSSCDLLS